MDKKEIDFLVEQVRSIILNEPLPAFEQLENDEFMGIQQAITYLSDCLSESNQFLKEIAMGNLAAPVPSRKNFLAGSLKNLHSGLKHLTWQANRVALGDYKQNVFFLGEFSESFNKMILQLKEREEKLRQQTIELEQSNILMKSIMDGIDDGIIVVSQEKHEVLYINKSARQLLYNKKDNRECVCKGECELLINCISQKFDTEQKHITRKYHCKASNSYFHIETFSMHWNGVLTYVMRIVDVTEELIEKSQIENMAYKDELTGLYNRRYCLSTIEQLINEKVIFTLCLIDADKLKYANDNFGHSAGDDYLKTIAKEITLVSRSSDIVCRLGGDEFAAIFMGCSEKLVVEKMNSINTKLAQLDSNYPMSISFGIEHVHPDSGVTAMSVLKQVDSHMYSQKRSKQAQ